MKLALLAIAVAAIVGQAPAQAVQPDPPHLIRGSFTAERQPDGNTVVFEDADALIVVDTGRHLDHQAKILDFAEARGKPIRIIVNTHWHLDHSGGNAEVRAAHPGALLYTSQATAGALEGFLARGLARGRARLEDPALSEAERAETRLGVEAIEDRANLLPDVVVSGPMELQSSTRRLQLRLAEHAATEGDVWIYDPATRTLIAGDLVVLPAPFFDTACADGWSEALAEIAEVPFVTLIPGHGEPMSRSDFGRYRKAFDRLLDCAAGDAAKKECVEGWQRDAGAFLITEQDRKDAAMLLDYYVDEILRSEAKKGENCGV